MKTQFSLVAFLGLFAGSSFGYEWSSGSSPATLGDGAVTLEYADGSVSGFKIAGGWLDTNVLTGDEISFADGGAISFAANGGFTFNNAVISAGALSVAGAEGDKPSEVNFTGKLTVPGFLTLKDDVSVKVSSLVLTAGGGVEIQSNATMRLAGAKPASDVKSAVITVRRGGTLENDTKYPYGVIANAHKIVLDGGTLSLEKGDARGAYFYANDLTFTNGGAVVSADAAKVTRPRVCASEAATKENATWKIVGTTKTPASCEGGAELVGTANVTKGDSNFTINVADVTGDESVDFLMGAMMRPGTNDGYGNQSTATSNNVYVYKTGVGSLKFIGANTYVGPTKVSAGTLVLGVNKATDYSAEYTFANDTALVCEPNCTNRIKKLTVSGNTTWTFGSGACLTVNAINTWSTGKTLTIVPPATGKKYLRFANTKGEPVVLSNAQLACMKTAEGHKVEQDDEGYVFERSRGVLLIFR